VSTVATVCQGGESFRSQPVNAGKGTVELRYDYGSSRWTPIELQKQYLTMFVEVLLRLVVLFYKNKLSISVAILKLKI